MIRAYRAFWESIVNVQQSIPMLPVEQASGTLGHGAVSSRPYHDPAWWELEKKAIFLRTWLHVGHVCEIPEPGSFIRREIEFARASLLIVRGKNGEVRTFHNVCTHRGTQLVEEAAGMASKFSCRYHMWTFGADGALLSAPDFERFHVSKEDCALKRVRTEVLAGMIFINFDPAPKESLRAFFGPIADELETLPVARATQFTEWSYEIEANWKTNLDNFQENYHLRFIHTRTGQAAIWSENPFGYASHYGFSGSHRSQKLWLNPDPPPPAQTLLLGYGRAAQLAAKDGHVFPKTDFKLFPALHSVTLPPSQHFTHTHMPLEPHRTRGTVRMYWNGEDDSASRRFTRELLAMSVRDVLSEDRWAVEAGQRGLNSGAIDKIQFQDHEILLRHLYEAVQKKVMAYLAEQEAVR